MREMRGERGGNAPPLQPPPAPPASMGLERPNRNQGVSISLKVLVLVLLDVSNET